MIKALTLKKKGLQSVIRKLYMDSSDHLNVDVVQRSLLFNVSTSLEDQDVTGERQETAHLSEGHISAELQLRNECETLWQELNNTHARLEARTRAGSSKVDEGGLDGSKVLEKVLKVKEKKLQTELIALENQGLQVTSANPEYTGTCLRGEVQCINPTDFRVHNRILFWFFFAVAIVIMLLFCFFVVVVV